MSRLRQEPLTGRWMIFSPERGDRPNAFERVTDHGGECPFCPGREDQTPPEIDRVGDAAWTIRVVPNLFPAVGRTDRSRSESDEPAPGKHEVIIESPSHDGCFNDYEDSHAIDVVRMWMARSEELSRLPAARAVILFHNRGRGAGASMIHPHSQAIALPFVPPRLAAQNQSFLGDNHCLLCRSSQKARESRYMILQTESFVAIAPYASRFPHQVWILPNRHQSRIEDMNDTESTALALILQRLLRTIRLRLDDPPINWAFHQAPIGAGGAFHWFLEIVPRLTAIAGYEIATESYINVIDPEETARTLRNDGGSDSREAE